MIKLLNDALAAEVINILCSRSKYLMTAVIRSCQTQAHADHLAERIAQLGGRPDVSPERLISWTHAAYVEVDSGGGMFTVDLSAERIAIEHYREKTVSLGAKNLASQQVLEMVLALDDAQAESLVSCVRDCSSEREIEVTALPSASCAQH